MIISLCAFKQSKFPTCGITFDHFEQTENVPSPLLHNVLYMGKFYLHANIPIAAKPNEVIDDSRLKVKRQREISDSSQDRIF